MGSGIARRIVGCTSGVCLASIGALVLGAGQAAQTPAPPAQGQAAPAAGRGQAPDTGPVRDASGAIIGFTKLAEIPGTPWRIHDAARPHPRVITPGATPRDAPSDAIMLFDGKDLSKWVQQKGTAFVDPTWPVHEGYFETGAGSGSLFTRESSVTSSCTWSSPRPTPRAAPVRIAATAA